MEGTRAVTRAILVALMLGVTACAGTAASSSPSAVQPTVPPGRVTRDSGSSTLIPAGFGSLKQEEIAIVLQPNGIRVTAIPLDESVIRVLAPDSYRTLRATLEGKRQQIAQRAAVHGVREPRVWYVTFAGLTPDARFVPTDMTVTSGGRDYRPFDVIGLTSGFGEQRLQPREIQRALLLFGEGLDVSQPVVVAMGSERNAEWSNDRSDSILSKIEAERAQVRARAGGRP
ncbi:MAG: hypothetical protein JWM41_4499 [Gemmatimonadetes bacterium]|nr:hypothetical protein [Gemmatimonadota bacterium]